MIGLPKKQLHELRLETSLSIEVPTQSKKNSEKSVRCLKPRYCSVSKNLYFLSHMLINQ